MCDGVLSTEGRNRPGIIPAPLGDFPDTRTLLTAAEDMATPPSACAVSVCPQIVVLIEEDPAVLDTYSRYFESRAVGVSGAATPEEGLRAVAELRPDLVITDISFRTGTHGVDVVHRLKGRAETEGIPLVVLTDRPVAELPAGTRRDVELFLRKPMDSAGRARCRYVARVYHRLEAVEIMDNLIDTAAHLGQLAVAFLLALPIAWDREQKERSAGLRTFTLVAISTCGFLMAARSSLGPSADAESRVWQGLLTGIGFIGSGAILKTEGSVTRHRHGREYLEHGRRRRSSCLRQLRHRRRSQFREFCRLAMAGSVQSHCRRHGSGSELPRPHSVSARYLNAAAVEPPRTVLIRPLRAFRRSRRVTFSNQATLLDNCRWLLRLTVELGVI